MRRDHHKLICEKGKSGNYEYHDIRHAKRIASSNDDFYEYEDGDEAIVAAPHKESIKRCYNSYYITKEFTDNVNPIRGFVRKNVGRKWDDVYSEFCDIYDQRSVLTKHLFQHLKQYVERKVLVHNDELMIRTRWRGLQPLEEAYIDYYVDPRDGILKCLHTPSYKSFNRQRKHDHEQELLKTIRPVDKLTEYHLINGTWFKVKFIEQMSYKELAEYSPRYSRRYAHRYWVTKYPVRYDVIKKDYVGEQRVAISKHTASKKEIRDHKLNKPVELAA